MADGSPEAPANSLTVGVPTFGRREIVCRGVADLIGAGAAERAQLLVIDDASPDGTREALARVGDGTELRVLRNESNLGYAGNVLRLFEECRTPYLLIASDDDAVVVESLAPLRQLLEERSPAFVSPQCRAGGGLYRGRAEIGPIGPVDLLAAASHAPGLVYRVADCRELALPAVAAGLREGSEAARVYPQLLILARLLLAGRRCLWWDRPTIESGDWAPTGIRDGSGAPYYHLGPRWRQLQDLSDFLRGQRDSAAEPAAAELMAARVEEGIFWKLRFAIEQERPDLIDAFDRSAARFYAGRWRWERLRRRFNRRRAAGPRPKRG